MWDEESVIYSESADTYFDGIYNLICFINNKLATSANNNVIIKEFIDGLMLLKCEPLFVKEIDTSIYYREYDDEGEFDIPSELIKETEKLNKFINEGKFILGYSPVDIAIVLSDDSLNTLKISLETDWLLYC